MIKSTEKYDIDKLFNYIVNTTLPKVKNVRYIPIKHLVFHAYKTYYPDLTTSYRAYVTSELIRRLSKLLEKDDYRLIKQQRRFTKLKDVESMIELYEIPFDQLNKHGSFYFEKTRNFITIYDVEHNTSPVAANFNTILNNK